MKSKMTKGKRSGEFYMPSDDEDFDTMRKNAMASKAEKDKERKARVSRITKKSNMKESVAVDGFKSYLIEKYGNVNEMEDKAQKPNPNAKKREGERKVSSSDNCILYFNKDDNEYRCVKKAGTNDDGYYTDEKEDAMITMKKMG